MKRSPAASAIVGSVESTCGSPRGNDSIPSSPEPLNMFDGTLSRWQMSVRLTGDFDGAQNEGRLYEGPNCLIGCQSGPCASDERCWDSGGS